MRLLEVLENGDFCFTRRWLDQPCPPYAILSHTWGDEAQEVTFDDLNEGSGRDKAGFEKIKFCGEQAARDGLQYFWVDSCCIDKKDHSELSETIISMFRWYHNAKKCYVYLSDVLVGNYNNDQSQQWWEPAFRKSRWFTRGWTLQELLAPEVVEFYSHGGKFLGDKKTLQQQIHEVTAIPISALGGAPLSDFRVAERMSWAQTRDTTRKEDKAYSLFGIFDVSLPVLYGEGETKALQRLKQQIYQDSQQDSQQDNQVLKDLFVTDPRHDKTRLEETKGGLLRDSYRWILDHGDFRRWRDDPQSRLLWIKGDPGKGKTMLLCGIIKELEDSANPISYFFCQATEAHLSKAESVLRGLIYLLIIRKPLLISHVQAKYDVAGEKLFQGMNIWWSLKEILANMLKDPSLDGVTLIIDALDECMTDRPKLLDFLIQSSSSFRVKWIVSSRNWPEIEEKLDNAKQGVRLCLELNENSISAAVRSYIREKVGQLAKEKKYNGRIRDNVEQYLISNADDTFLWVALVCQQLAEVPRRHALAELKTFPPGLDSLYERMIEHIKNSNEDVGLCQKILAVASVVYRPITLKELKGFVEAPEDDDNDKELKDIIGSCGSFLTIREGVISFVHQSAKDFLLNKALDQILPSGIAHQHYAIFLSSLETLSRTLRRDIYSLPAPGFPADQVSPPVPDPLASSRYSSIYWVDHFSASYPTQMMRDCKELPDRCVVYRQLYAFLQEHLLHWLEALSLMRRSSDGIRSIISLDATISADEYPDLHKFISDAKRYVRYYRLGIEEAPLQIYYSALIFAPESSTVRRQFEDQIPKWIRNISKVQTDWSALQQTLEGHTDYVRAVTFSPDSKQLASASDDKTVRLWDPATGVLLQTLKGHTSYIRAVAFSPDSKQLASASDDKTVRLWDPSTGVLLQTIEGHTDYVRAVAFSPDSKQLASASDDKTVRLWDPATGVLLQTLKDHTDWVRVMAFSPDSKQLASASYDKKVRLWDPAIGVLLQTLEGHTGYIRAVAFSPDSKQLASASDDKTVRLWDPATGALLQTIEGHTDYVRAVAFSPDSKQLASASNDKTVRLWDPSTGVLLRTLEGHTNNIIVVAFSPDSSQLASASNDKTVRLWDPSTGVLLQTLEGHTDYVRAVTFSPDSKQLASASDDKTVRLWDPAIGGLLQTIEGHTDYVRAVAFSPDSKQLASASYDKTVRLWDSATGVLLQTLEGYTDNVRAVAFSPDSKQLASASDDKTVRLWNTATGASYAILHTNIAVKELHFSSDGQALDTDTGRLDIRTLSTTDTFALSRGDGIFVDGPWVFQGMQRTLWLPPEYRATCTAVNNHILAMGHGSGRVSILQIDAPRRQNGSW